MKILATNEVTKIIGRSKATLYQWWKVKKFFPQPILYNGRTVGWLESDINKWLSDKKHSD